MIWYANSSYRCRVQYTTSVIPQQWTDLATVTAASTAASYTDCPGGDGARFYRVVMLP